MKLLNTNWSKIWVIIFFLGSITNAVSQVSIFSHEKYISTTGDTLQYRQLVCDYDTISKYPLVIFLHGVGENGNDNEAQLKWGVMDFASTENMKLYHPIVIAPQCPHDMSWSNFSFDGSLTLQPTPTKPMQLLIELINQTIKNLPIDPNRIYITGLSSGGFGTFDAISRYPNLFAAAVPICGAGDVSKAQDIAHIPIWMFHGALDDAVNPGADQNMVKALTKAGAHPGFTQYPETGHFAWLAAYSDPMMMAWLFKQHK